MTKDNKHMVEQELMEAFTYAEDANIGMPDIEAELLRVRAKAARPARNASVFIRIAGVAACVIVVVTLGWSVFSYTGDTDGLHDGRNGNLCVAYVAGERITNEEQVLDMMAEDIMNMNGESDIVGNQLNDFFNE